MSAVQDQIAAAVLDALVAAQLGCPLPQEIALERPKNRDHGDYATNIALALAKPAGKSPREVAELIVAALKENEAISAVDIAGPGFINITVAKSSQAVVITNALTQGKLFGHGQALAGVAINLEFVSANPTGPLHLGHTRWAAVGDALGRVLSAAGAKVTREFYVNDRGNQMALFGKSIRSSALGQPRPEDGYHGAYIDDIAAEIVATHPEYKDLPEEQSDAAFLQAGYQLQLAQQQRVLDGFGTHFDNWFSEKSLYEKDFREFYRRYAQAGIPTALCSCLQRPGR